MQDLKDALEGILTVGLVLASLAAAWVVVAVVLGMSYGIAARAANWVM